MTFITFILFAALILSHDTFAATQLKNYSIDKSKITVSGISSGAAMASQLHIAFSSQISGSGTIAGPPYYCSNGLISVSTTLCMSSLFGININILTNKISSFWQQNLIDNPDNLKNHNVYIFSGSRDTVVAQNVVKKSEELFLAYMSTTRVKSVYNVPAAHGMVTNFFGASCSVKSNNYLNNCDYNQAYDVLKTMYPKDDIIENKKYSQTSGTYIEFDQTEFFPSSSSSKISMDSTGYMYVPVNCSIDNSNCKLHLAFHGCSQGKSKIGLDYIQNSGYSQSADLNNIIIVFPQATSSLLTNPFGCWDWWGYSSSNFANKNGLQMKAVKAIIDRISS